MISVTNPSVPQFHSQSFCLGGSALSPSERQRLAIGALARIQPISHLAGQNHVSRKFVYQQAAKAGSALEDAFQPSQDGGDEVLFVYPVTKDRIRQIVLALLLHTHGSIHGVQDWLRDILNYSLSIGTIHNIMTAAVEKARQMNTQEDLSRIRIGVHDEIFQGNPVLVGIDPLSTYCFLLAQEPNRDATTWGVHLLDLVERGFRPKYTVADFGTGLRAGQAEALPGTPCWGDVFHAQMDVGAMVFYLENRALGAMARREKLQRKMDRAKKRGQGHTLSKILALASMEEAKSIQLADDLRLLGQWLREDVLAVVGPELAIRRELFDFIVSEIRQREDLAPHRIRPVRIALENRRDMLLAFAAQIDLELNLIAQKHQLPLPEVRAVYELGGLSHQDPRHGQREALLSKILGTGTCHSIRQDIDQGLKQIVRASSMVENLNSRLRSYFFLRRHLGADYLELLRFFFNHRPYPRSRKEERVGKSPAEILAGTPSPHWLQQLGFVPFRRAA